MPSELRPGAPGCEISVVVPLYNEEGNVAPLLAELLGALRALGRRFEVICVDDGSADGTFAALAQAASAEPCLRVLRFRRNYGQTAAMSAGIEAARGEVIVPMDGDLQNDPADIAKLLAELERGHDVVSGWRKDRKDRELGRKLPSRVANWLISSVSGVRLHDYGCSLKAYRREVLEGVRLYGEMHRFIPIYASWQGARVTEMIVNHRPRHAGRSKYGLGRTLKVVLDLLVVKFLASYITRPIYLFGGAGLVALLCSVAAFGAALFYKLAGRKDLVETPLPLLAVAFALAGILCLLMGLLAELVVRTYYESQDKRPYLIAQEIQGSSEDPSREPSQADSGGKGSAASAERHTKRAEER